MKLPYSLNNRVIVEPYKKEELKSEVKHGFAFIGQKKTVKGLKLLVDAVIPGLGQFSIDGVSMPLRLNRGDMVFFKEEHLHNSQAIKDVLHADGIEGEFIIMDASLIQFVAPKNEEVETFERP